MHPSTGSKNQTGPLFFSISLLCFSPCQAEQSRHRHLQFPSPRFAQEGRSGCPGYSGPCGELQGPTANHISTVSHCSTSCRFCPAALQLRMRDVKNHCLVPAPLQASSSACWSSSPTSAWPLEHGALCQHCWPCQQHSFVGLSF